MEVAASKSNTEALEPQSKQADETGGVLDTKPTRGKDRISIPIAEKEKNTNLHASERLRKPARGPPMTKPPAMSPERKTKSSERRAPDSEETGATPPLKNLIPRRRSENHRRET
jgi:hypothetical protein